MTRRFRKTAVVAKRAKDSGAPAVREVVAYGVACVMTPAEKRGKGYASHMLRLLHWALAPPSALPSAFPAEWGARPDPAMLHAAGVANAQFSILYSSVGRDFYCSAGTTPGARDGWVIKGTVETFKRVDDLQTAPTAPVPRGLNFRRLCEDNVRALWNHDAEWIKDDLARYMGETDQTLFSFLPHQGVGAYVMRRIMDFDEKKQPVLPLSQWGLVVLPEGTSFEDALRQKSPPSFVTWTIGVKEPPRSLAITRLRADAATFPVILEQLLEVAREVKVDQVQFLYLRPELQAIAQAHGWKTIERDELMSAVKWYGEEWEEDLDWVHNEWSVVYIQILLLFPQVLNIIHSPRFCWC
ncbi:hypothetical protein BD413DRAFT_519434 [Trametes elegans]|nr:hypothetical protein BD413DRAFT_519434 [Trametes elegans]